MPLQITMNPRPAGNLSIAANQRARFSSVVSLPWDSVTGKPDFASIYQKIVAFDDNSEAEAFSVASSVDAIVTFGYTTAGDGGGATYKRSASEPSHNGKIQSADGAWWELSEEEPNLYMFGAVGDNSTDNATAIDNAFGYCLARYEDGLPVELKIPGGVFRKSTSISLSAVFPISGVGKTSSRIVYTGSGVGMLLVPPTAPGTMFTNTNDGYHWRDFSIEPLNAGGGTYGIEIRVTVGQFAYSSLEHIRIGDFGTSSLYLNNSADLADGIFTSSFVECDFLNGVTAVNIGDNVHFVNPKIHGDTVSSFTMKAGARRLMIHGGSLTGSGGLDFQDCNGVDLVEPHVEIFSGTSYNGGLNGLVRFLDCTEVSIQNARVAKVGTGTKSAYAIAIEGTTSGVTIIDPEMAMGSSGHITAASTTSDVLVVSPKVDEGYSSRVITLAGARSREMGGGVVTAGDADLTIKPSDRVIVLGAALTSNRTLTLPALADVEDDHEIVFIDAAGGLGTYSWVVARASTNTIQGATSLTIGTQLGRFTLRKVSSSVWSYGRLPVTMGGTGASTAATARTNLGLRNVLAADETYYVRSDGSDSNTGLANTAGGAFLTIQKAINVVAALDIGTYNVTIQVADGTYTGTIVITGPWLGSGTVTIQGNNGTPSNVLISTGASTSVLVQAGGRLTIKDLKLQATGGGSFLLQATTRGSINFGNLDIGQCTSQQLRAQDNGSITCDSNYKISAGAANHWAATAGGVIRVQSKTITVNNAPRFSGAFASGSIGGVMIVNGNTFSYPTITITSANPGVFTHTAHNKAANDQISFATTGALPTNIVAGTTYYIKTVTDANTYTVSATAGGAEIDCSAGVQSGTHTARAVGSRYAATDNGTIYTAAGGTTILPGNAAGTGTNPGTSPYGLYD